MKTSKWKVKWLIRIDTKPSNRLFYGVFSDSDSFRARHPITTYEHYRELIRRIAAGEDKVIISEKPLILAMTSGTSGPSAMLLSTKDTNTEFFLQVKLDDDVMRWPGCSLCRVVVHMKLILIMILISVFPPGSDCVFGRHAKSVSWYRQPPANHQVLLLAYFSPVWGRYSHRTKLLHTSLLPPHAQPLHHPSTCLWGTGWSALFYYVYCSVPTGFWIFHAEFVNYFPFLNCICVCPLFQVLSEKDTLYLHLLFALKDPSVGTLESNFASTVFYAFSVLQVLSVVLSLFCFYFFMQRQHFSCTLILKCCVLHAGLVWVPPGHFLVKWGEILSQVWCSHWPKEKLCNLFDEVRIRKVISIPSRLRPTGSLARARGGHWTREGQQRSGSGARIEVQARGSDEAGHREGRTAPGPLPGRLLWDRQAAVASPPPCAGSGLRLQPDLWGNVKGELLPRSAFLFALLCGYWR